jgi:quercetin dioxygenase-like cupin family protein
MESGNDFPAAAETSVGKLEKLPGPAAVTPNCRRNAPMLRRKREVVLLFPESDLRVRHPRPSDESVSNGRIRLDDVLIIPAKIIEATSNGLEPLFHRGYVSFFQSHMLKETHATNGVADKIQGSWKLLLDESNFGGKELEMAEITIPAGTTVSSHTHRSIEVIYVLSGTYGHEVNGHLYLLKPGMMGVVRPGDHVRQIPAIRGSP